MTEINVKSTNAVQYYELETFVHQQMQFNITNSKHLCQHNIKPGRKAIGRRQWCSKPIIFDCSQCECLKIFLRFSKYVLSFRPPKRQPIYFNIRKLNQHVTATQTACICANFYVLRQNLTFS